MNVGEQISLFDLDTSFSKMSQDCLAQTTEKITELSLNQSPESSITIPQFLDCRTERVGLMQGAFWETNGLSLGEYTTQSFGESPKVAVESHLSQILEDTPHPKHSLSVRTSQGLYRRMEKIRDIPPRCENSSDEASEPIMIEMGSTKHTIIRDGICVTLKARMGTGGENVNAVIRENGIYRLSPLEVERLQGYPDNWSDIGDWIDSKGHKRKSADSQRYKALGNSIALPFWEWLAERIVALLKAEGVERPTMASLFDGLGGFPLVFSRCGCQPVWASEIEDFCIAVTKYHFPGD